MNTVAKQQSYFPRQKRPHAVLAESNTGKKRPNAGVAYEGKMKAMKDSPFYPRKKRA